LKGALAKHAEAVFSTLGTDDQGAFPLVMRHLVTLGQGEEEVPNRRTPPYRDFVGSGETDQDQKAGAKGFVDLFVEKRLLVTDTDSQGEVEGIGLAQLGQCLLPLFSRAPPYFPLISYLATEEEKI
jgi:hypothetical protein